MIEKSKHYALAIACGAKRGPKDSDLTFSPASLRDFLKALDQPEQEPVAWADMEVRGEDKGLSWTPGHFHKTPLYTTPPQRKPLTKDEIRDGARKTDPAGEDLCSWSFERGVRFAEDAHGIKGEA